MFSHSTHNHVTPPPLFFKQNIPYFGPIWLILCRRAVKPIKLNLTKLGHDPHRKKVCQSQTISLSQVSTVVPLSYQYRKLSYSQYTCDVLTYGGTKVTWKKITWRVTVFKGNNNTCYDYQHDYVDNSEWRWWYITSDYDDNNNNDNQNNDYEVVTLGYDNCSNIENDDIQSNGWWCWYWSWWWQHRRHLQSEYWLMMLILFIMITTTSATTTIWMTIDAVDTGHDDDVDCYYLSSFVRACMCVHARATCVGVGVCACVGDDCILCLCRVCPLCARAARVSAVGVCRVCARVFWWGLRHSQHFKGNITPKM